MSHHAARRCCIHTSPHGLCSSRAPTTRRHAQKGPMIGTIPNRRQRPKGLCRSARPAMFPLVGGTSRSRLTSTHHHHHQPYIPAPHRYCTRSSRKILHATYNTVLYKYYLQYTCKRKYSQLWKLRLLCRTADSTLALAWGKIYL
jgi:hypothetical protein